MKHRIFITGSSDGLGLLAGKILVEQGHSVVLHARDKAKAQATKEKLPGCEAVVVGDVSTIEEMKSVAKQVNDLGQFTSVIHNVGVYQVPDRQVTVDGVTQLFAVNVLAPYVLTALIKLPERLIYMSSGMHSGGDESLEDPQFQNRRWNTTQAYSDSKLFDLILAKAIARRWPKTLSNTVNPGWVPTRMGGAGAPDDLYEGAETQAWLAASDEPEAKVSGQYFHHMTSVSYKRVADDEIVQSRLLKYLEQLTHINLE